MKIYNPDAKCPKCGCAGIKNRFTIAGHYIENSSGYRYQPRGEICLSQDETFVEIKQDCIERTCFNCGYSWEELPLDEPKKWDVNDYFDRKSGSKVWPSSDPKDTPFDTFTCKICGYTFTEQMYGAFSDTEKLPETKANEKMLSHIAEFHKGKAHETS